MTYLWDAVIVDKYNDRVEKVKTRVQLSLLSGRKLKKIFRDEFTIIILVRFNNNFVKMVLERDNSRMGSNYSLFNFGGGISYPSAPSVGELNVNQTVVEMREF